MATLLIFMPDGEQSHELADDVVTVGRISDNTVQIDDPSVSSHHARITSLDGKFEIEDLNSTNGLRVGGLNISKASLGDGTRLRFGNVEAVFQSNLGGDIMPLPETEGIGAKVAETTRRPADFLNASPFGKRSSKKDRSSKLIMALALLAMLIAIGVVANAFMLKPPI